MDSIRVLYVEDDRADRDRTHRHLARHAPHIKLTVAGSVAEALERVTVGDVDVLLAGYRLPETRDIRILGVTGHPSVVPVLRGAGADACVTKPLDPDAVVRELDRLITSTRVSHSLTEREG